MKCVVEKGKFPSWERLWDEFTHKDIQERSQSRDNEKVEGGVDEENVFLAVKIKGRNKKGSYG